MLYYNPYKDVDWDNDEQYKANFHTHTNESDGSFSPDEVIDIYKSRNYDILALTDHNRHTWPWEKWGKSAEELNMLAVEGNEPSWEHHRGSYLCDLDGSGQNYLRTFLKVRKKGGLSSFKHPGRYWDIEKEYEEGEEFSLDWYAYYFERELVTLLEVFNLGDRYPDDRKLWDKLLKKLSPKKIFGMANDDFHHEGNQYQSYNMMIMSDLTTEKLKKSLSEGSFYFCYEPNKTGLALAPKISKIEVDEQQQVVNIIASNYNNIEWIVDGENHSFGESINYNQNMKYFRAKINGDDGMAFTQPFYLFPELKRIWI